MSQTKLLAEKRFLPLFCTQFLGAFNDNVFKNAFVLMMTYHGVSVLGIPSTEMGAVAGALFILPFFLFSAIAGQLAEKLDKHTLIKIIKIIEIGIMVVATLGLCFSWYELLLVTLLLLGIHATFFGPVKYSILPELLTEDELVGGNAIIEAGTFLAILAGTIVGGVLIGIEGSGPILVSFTVLILAILGWLSSIKIPFAKAVNPNLQISWNPITETFNIIKLARLKKPVFLSILGISWLWFFGAFLLSIFPTLCKDWLKTNENVATLFLAIFSVGTALGSLVCEKLSRRHIELGLVPLGSIGMSLFAFDLAFAIGESPNTNASLIGVLQYLQQPSSPRTIIDLFFLSIFSGIFVVPLYAFIQSRTVAQERSRIIAANNIINAIFMVTSSLLVIFLLRMRFTLPQVFTILSILNLLVAIYIYTVVPEFLIRLAVWFMANVIYRLRVVGEENIPTKGAAVLVCNHVTFVDWMIISAGVGRPVRYVMDHTFMKGWFLKKLLTQAKVIPIAPQNESPEILAQAFEQIAYELNDKEIVCIFPEGKITKDGAVNPFKNGVEKVLANTPTVVIPMALCNLWGSYFSRERGHAIKKVPKRFWSKIELRIGKPLSHVGQTADTLKSEVKKLLN